MALGISGFLLILQSHISMANEYSLSLPHLAPTLSVLITCFLAEENRVLIQICKTVPLTKNDVIFVPIIFVLTMLTVILTAETLTFPVFPYLKWNGTALNTLLWYAGVFLRESGGGAFRPHGFNIGIIRSKVH